MKEPRKSVRPCWPENISHGQTPGSCSLLWASLHPVTLCPLKPDSHFGEVIWTPRRNSYRLNFPLSGHVQLLLSPWFTWELCGMVFFFFLHRGGCVHGGNGSNDDFWIMLYLLQWDSGIFHHWVYYNHQLALILSSLFLRGETGSI